MPFRGAASATSATMAATSSAAMGWNRPGESDCSVRSMCRLLDRQWWLQLGSDRTSPRFHLSARLRALPPEREWSAKRYPADALPFEMQYCLSEAQGACY